MSEGVARRYSQSDLEANLGRPLTDAEARQAELWTEWAEATVARRTGGLDQLDQDMLRMVLVESVSARLRRPDPVTQVSVRVDDASVMRSYAASTGLIEIRPEWWEALGVVETGAFSVSPYGEPGRHVAR